MMRFVVCAVLALALVSGCGRSRAPEPEPIAAVPTYVPEGVISYPKFGDSDPHPWEGRTPYSYPVHGIDVSRWQGDIDWRTVRASGVSFAFIKATEGGDFLDPMFKTHLRGAQRAGMRYGAYHYYYFCRPAEEQARWFIKNVPRDDRALPHVLDMEWTPHSKTCTLRPDGATVRAEAKKFLRILEKHYGRRPVIYSTVDFYRDTEIGKLKGTDFWLRSVAAHPRKTYPRSVWAFWQYTGTGIVPGISGNVDINVFRGSPETWAQWAQ
jgi:lysozyme